MQIIARSYSWVTVVPAELVGRLGGAGRLRATGAFVAVEELPSGGLWLQATETPAHYAEDAVHRVFQALAPALPVGQPRRDPADENVRRLVWEDAADGR